MEFTELNFCFFYNKTITRQEHCQADKYAMKNVII